MIGLLDTHVLIWRFEDAGRLSTAQTRIFNRAGPDSPLAVSGISLWEIAMLHVRGRIEFSIPLRDWLQKAVAPPLVRLVGISPAIAAEVAALPSSFHGDPADRILVATARTLGAKLLTQDRRIVEAGIVETVA